MRAANRWLVFLAPALFLATSCSSRQAAPLPPPGSVGGNGNLPPRAAPPSTSQSYAQFLPDSTMTPGDALDVTTADVCVSGYAKKVRNVPSSVKNQAYQAYGITRHEPGEYEVDHLISLELGGSNSIRNLWPQSYRTQPWNARVKDALENELHRLICSGQVDMRTAQQEIARDWIAAYKKYFHTDQPLSGGGQQNRSAQERSGESNAPAANHPPSPNAAGMVWVNTRSGKYFPSGSSHYGNTREGKYMSEAEAQQQGYVAAKGN